MYSVSSPPLAAAVPLQRRLQSARGYLAVAAVEHHQLGAAREQFRGAAFIDRVQAFLGAEPPIEDIVFIVDLTAAGTRQIAAEQRFQHQNEGVFFPAGEALAQDICADADFLN